MAFVEPLELQTILINIFAGDFRIFTAISLLAITGLAGYFRMTGIVLMFMIGLFFIMFSDFVDVSIYFILISIGGLLIGYWISKVVKG